MPLIKNIQHDAHTKILVWQITESYEDLVHEVVLQPSNQLRVNNMKSKIHQRAFLCVRKLFMEIGHTDHDLYYDEYGKPHLKNEKHISITHSHDYAAIIISNKKVGIDIELQRDKIIKIADKFSSEKLNKSANDYIRKLTVIWGAKEAIFKIKNEKGISFKDHINVILLKLNKKKLLQNLNLIKKTKNLISFFKK